VVHRGDFVLAIVAGEEDSMTIVVGPGSGDDRVGCNRYCTALIVAGFFADLNKVPQWISIGEEIVDVVMPPPDGDD
jgi:hypothetical protein